jgi:hypothetical protein
VRLEVLVVRHALVVLARELLCQIAAELVGLGLGDIGMFD